MDRNLGLPAMVKVTYPSLRQVVMNFFKSRSGKTFNLTRVFAAWSLIGIALIFAALSYFQSIFLTQQILERDAAVTQEFIQSIVNAEETASAFNERSSVATNQKLTSFFGHLVKMRDVLASNVYNDKGKIIWSSNPRMTGENFQDNDELTAALAGALNFETGIVGHLDKAEHAELSPAHIGFRFVETYAPILDPATGKVVGVVEVYKLPRALQQSLSDGLFRLWASALVGGSLLFATLFGIVSRADKTIVDQHRKLMEVEALAMVGDTVAAVTHSIRNPLASIRAAAELSLTDDLEGARESAREIISETDRVSRWTRELLYFSKHQSGAQACEELDLNSFAASTAADFKSSPANARTTIESSFAKDLPAVSAAAEPTRHVIISLLANAHHAMPKGGKIAINTRYEPNSGSVLLTIEDEGPGLGPVEIEKAMKPFYSTKSGGTGLGLPLARQIMERFGGSLTLSRGTKGLLVTLRFREVSARSGEV
jgi:two-component system, NtrC family, sensor histidine kinase HydH